MGNNNSQHSSHAPTEVVRRPPARPKEPPSARLVSSLGPQGPSYHSPENLVLPKELPTEFKLRPVSMELSKYNPDFENMYSYNDINGYEGDNNNEKMGEMMPDDVNMSQSPPRPLPPVQNGHIPGTAPQSAYDSPGDAKPVANNVKPGNHVPYRPSHRRQMSLTNNLTGHTIMEEPEEDIDSRIKLDPLMQSFPGATGPSLPVKNTSNLDYSYQLTYAQLAEARRNKTLEDLEKRTGKRLSDLSADLSEHSDKPAFERGSAVRTSSKSLGSAISTKKKKAPTPPGAAPPAVPASVSLPNSPRSPPSSKSRLPYSIENEPPADYDLESPRRKPYSNMPKSKMDKNLILPRYSTKGPVSSVKPILKNSNTAVAPPAPPPPPGAAPKKAVNLSRNNSLSTGKPELIFKKAPSVQSPKPKTPEVEDGAIPWLLEIKNKSEARAARQQSQESLSSSDKNSMVDVKKLTDEEKNAIDIIDQILSPNDSEQKDKVIDDQAQKKQTESFTKTFERSNSLKDITKPSTPKLQRNFSQTAFDKQSSASPVMHRQNSSSSLNTDPIRRLSSLLQHDIKAAANAKCTKLVKQTIPVKPKPKDPHTVFREQLQKACSARDERVKVDGTIDDNLQKNPDKVGRIVDEDDEDNVSIGVRDSNTDKDSERDTSSVSSREPPDVLPKPPRYHKNVTLNKQAANINNKPRHIKSIANEANKSKRPVSAQSLDWAPEDDLDSDDNLSDREQLTGRKAASAGFKSTIIPSNVNDLKQKKKGKKKAKDPESYEDQGKSKIGSVKKFKKSMHKSVKNAFGSISKASGKILRRQKTEDFEVVEDAPKNWKFSNDKQRMSNGNDYNRNSYMNGYGDYHDDPEDESDSDGESRNLDDIDFSAPMFRQNGDVHSDEESPEEEDLNSSQTIKRAGVAYVNPEGKLVVIPDSGADTSERKAAKQKEMERYNASLKRKEKSAKAARVSQEIREREKKHEEDKRKQLELELELTKMREAETRERLQRLENAHLQQQINAQLIQQQQQQNMSMLSAPPLPSSGPYQTPIPNTPQTQAFTTNIFGQQVPQSTYNSNFGMYQQNGPVLQNNVPIDLNDYMRVLGIQNPPTSQQMAYFLNNMTLSGQPFDIGSSPNLFTMVNQEPMKQFPNGMLGYPNMDSSVKKQSFQTWASTPNINHTPSNVNTNDTSLPLADFVTDFNGASAKNSEKDNKKSSKGRNPLYNSDDSDEGLSPQKTVACGNVIEYRTLPVRTESGKFMKTYSDDKFDKNTRTLPVRTESGKFMKQFGEDYSKNKSEQNIGYHHVVRVGSSSVTDLNIGDFSHQQRSVSPTNSSSTIDSAITSAGSTLSTPPSPSKQHDTPMSPLSTAKLPTGSGFRTVLDLSSPSCTAKIYTDEEFQNGH